MSERMHSAPTKTVKSKTKLVPVLVGTAAAVLVAGIAFQVFRAEEAVSQTRPAASSAPAGAARTGSAEAAGTTLARVNGQPVTYDIVARECVERHGEEVLDNIINRMIIQQECQRRGVSVSMAEIQQEVVSISKKFNLPVETWYQMLATEREITKEQYHRDVIWPMLALKRLAGTQTAVTEPELQQMFVRDYGPRVKARMIFIDGNLRHANQIWEQAKANPDDFDRLAQEFSSDPNTRPLGGVVPPIRKFGGTPQIEQEAFRLKQGEVSPVIQIAESRYVILKCEGFTDPIVNNLEEVRTELEAQLAEEKTQQAVAKIFEDLKGKAEVYNHLTNTSSAGSPYANANVGQVRPAGGAAPGSPVRPVGAAQ